MNILFLELILVLTVEMPPAPRWGGGTTRRIILISTELRSRIARTLSTIGAEWMLTMMITTEDGVEAATEAGSGEGGDTKTGKTDAEAAGLRGTTRRTTAGG